MKHDFEHHGVVYNIITSSPIIGTPSRFLFDYTALGIRESGRCVGLLKGGVVGVIFFVMVLVLSEAIPLGWEIIHYYFQMEYVEPVKSDVRFMLLRTEADDKHPPIRHWHDKFDFDLEWLNPGRYLLKEDPMPESSEQEDQ